MSNIDAERLKAEIGRRKLSNRYVDTEGYEAELFEIIDSLQQEQQEQKKKCNDCPHCVDRKDQYGWHFKGCFGGPYKGKFIAEIDECPLKQEQSKKED